MATIDENDEAEELRFLALQSMVRRSKKKKVSINETDDQDIRLLRAAALKSITHRSNSQNNQFLIKDDNPVKNLLINEKKRSLQVSSLGNKKIVISNESKNNNLAKHTTTNKPSGAEHIVQEHKPQLEPDSESQSKPVAVNKDNVKKIIRNGSIQLSNLDSDKFDETMVLHITFSSSESDDSSTECNTIENAILQKSIAHQNINNSAMRPTVSITDSVDNNSETADSNSLDDKKSKMNSCLEKICGLMKNCESAIEKRNEQVNILLEAYEKYQNYSESLRSILQSMQNVRDELSIYCSAEPNSTEN